MRAINGKGEKFKVCCEPFWWFIDNKNHLTAGKFGTSNAGIIDTFWLHVKGDDYWVTHCPFCGKKLEKYND